MNSRSIPGRVARAVLLPALCVLAGGAAATPDPPPEAVLATLPFLGEEPNRVYIDLAPEGSTRPFRLLLDTGANESVLTPRAARALGVRIRRLKRDPYRRKTLLGRDLQFYVDTRRSDTAARTSWEYGLLGGSFLDDYVVELDFPQRRVRFLDRRRYEVPEAVDAPDEAVVPLKIVSSRPGIEIAIDGAKHLVLLDTGAPLPLVLSGPNAAKSSIASRPVPGFATAGVMGAVESELGLAERVVLGPFEFARVPAVVAPKGWFNQGFPGDSILGYDLLAQFVVRIDYPRARIWLRRVPEPRVTWIGQPWSEIERTGAHLAPIEGQAGFRVQLVLPDGIADRRGLRPGDRVETSDTRSEIAARIAAGEALTVLRPGRKIDEYFDLLSLPTAPSAESGARPDEAR